MLYFISMLLIGPVMVYAFDGLLYLSDIQKLPEKEKIFVAGLFLVTLVPGRLFSSKLKLPRRFDARYLPLILMPFLCILLPWFFSGEVYLLRIVQRAKLFAIPYSLFLFGFFIGIRKREPSCLRRRGLCYLAAITIVACLIPLASIYPLLNNTFFYQWDSVGRHIRMWDYFPVEKNSLAKPDNPPSLRIAFNHPSLMGNDYLLPLFGAAAQATYSDIDRSDELDYDFLYGPYALHDPDITDKVSYKDHDIYSELKSEPKAGRSDTLYFGTPLSQAQLEALDAAGRTSVQTPIAKNALVFFVHRDNPVQGLTTEQIRRIYAGDINTWTDIGGNGGRILAFQHRHTAVQTVMEKNVMLGRMLGLPPQEEHPEFDFSWAEDYGLPIGPPKKIPLKGNFVRVNACYRNRIDAIGYDFYWKALQRFPNGEIRLLAVDGIMPTQENISNGSYPFSLPIVMLANTSLTPEAKALHDWLISPEGQALIAKTGYAPLPTEERP